jgi:hypothetical protein
LRANETHNKRDPRTSDGVLSSKSLRAYGIMWAASI